MADDALRELEREWRESGDPRLESRYLRARLRTGELTRDSLELAAWLGHEPAQEALGDDAPEPLDEDEPDAFPSGLLKRWPKAAARAAVALTRSLMPTQWERNGHPADEPQQALEELEAWVRGERGEVQLARIRAAAEATLEAYAQGADSAHTACMTVCEPDSLAVHLAHLWRLATWRGQPNLGELTQWALGEQDVPLQRLREGGLRLGREPEFVRAVDFTPDGKRALSTSLRGTLTLWDVATRSVLRSFPPRRRQVFAAVFAPDAPRIVAGDEDGRLFSWSSDDLEQAEPFWTVQAHQGRVDDVVVLPGGEALTNGYDKVVILWDVERGEELARRPAGSSHLAVSADSTTVASGAEENRVELWTLRDQKLLRIIEHPGALQRLAFLPDGRRLATASYDGRLRVWEVATGELLRVLEPQGRRPRSIYALAVSPDGTRMATGTDTTIHVWDVESGEELACWWTWGLQLCMAASPDGLHFLSGARNGALRLYQWDWAS